MADIYIYKFLLVTEIDRQFNTVLLFTYDLKRGEFSESVKQFTGVDAVFLGLKTDLSPSLFVLNEDRQTAIIDVQGNKYGIERGKYKIKAMVKNVFWTPFAQGHALVYESKSEHIIRFSRNRLLDSPIHEFGVLEDIGYSFRMHYDEIIFHFTWQNNLVPIYIYIYIYIYIGRKYNNSRDDYNTSYSTTKFRIETCIVNEDPFRHKRELHN